MILVSVPQGMCHLVDEKGLAVDRPWCEVAVDLEGDQAVQGTEQAEQAVLVPGGQGGEFCQLGAAVLRLAECQQERAVDRLFGGYGGAAGGCRVAG